MTGEHLAQAKLGQATRPRYTSRVANLMRKLTYEFVVPTEVFVIDASDWPSIPIIRNDLEMQIRKPIVGQKLVGVAETIGNVRSGPAL